MTPPGAPEEANHAGRGAPSRFDRLVLLLATGFGLGYAPFAPGTFGSLAGLPLAWGIHQLPEWAQVLAAGLAFAIGIPICSRAAHVIGLRDPGAVVFDEIAAFTVVFFGTPMNGATATLGFLLFRVFDVWKPWPARRLEQLPSGWGIMADDFAAAFYSAAVLWLIAWQFPLG